jgi:hypothetical protein
VFEADVNRWPALAGWRGLHDPEVQSHFNRTFYAYDEAYGNDAAMIKNGLRLDYKIGYFGADVADGLIKARLEQGLPTLFYLWSPHQLQPQFKLSRIQLWPFQSEPEFREGKSDYPVDFLEKVVSKSLAQIAPQVSKLVARYMISNPNQEGIMAAVDRDNITAHGASCAWLLNAKNAAEMLSWIPPPEVRRSLSSHPFCGLARARRWWIDLVWSVCCPSRHLDARLGNTWLRRTKIDAAYARRARSRRAAVPPCARNALQVDPLA